MLFICFTNYDFVLLGNIQNSCITNAASPSSKSKRCTRLHISRPDLKNVTVHLFKSTFNVYQFIKTCYPAFAGERSKGWCATRRPDIDENQVPKEESGWGFCSTDPSQEDCNVEIKSDMEDSMPHVMSFLNEDYCALQLKRNIRVEQPDELDNFKEKLDRSETFCVGQIHYHEFEKEAFVADGKTFTDIEEITKSLKVYLETFTNLIHRRNKSLELS